MITIYGYNKSSIVAYLKHKIFAFFSIYFVFLLPQYIYFSKLLAMVMFRGDPVQ